jgi:hypothetical protein
MESCSPSSRVSSSMTGWSAKPHLVLDHGQIAACPYVTIAHKRNRLYRAMYSS